MGTAAACRLPVDSAHHFRDLTLPCALVADPFAERDRPSPKDRQRLQLGVTMASPDAQRIRWCRMPATNLRTDHGPRLSSTAAGLVM